MILSDSRNSSVIQANIYSQKPQITELFPPRKVDLFAARTFSDLVLPTSFVRADIGLSSLASRPGYQDKHLLKGQHIFS